MRIIKKIILNLFKIILKGLEILNSRLYMKYFNIYLKILGIDMLGTAKYVHSSVWFDGVDYSKIHIENDVVISKYVKVLVHDYSIARAINAIEKLKHNKKEEEMFLKDIYIGENSFIGADSIILYGTTIGKNVIVGAGSVVKGNFPDNSIIAGNPAKIIGDSLEWGEKHKNLNDYIIR